MWKYVLKRLFWLIITTICVAILIFVVMWFVPGDPAQIIAGSDASMADIERVRAQLGLDKPFLVQLWDYMSGIFFHLDFGISYSYKVPVIQEFVTRLPRTVVLGLISVLITTCGGVPIGIMAARHRNTIRDQGVLFLAMIFISMPQFWFAEMLVLLFAQKLGWLPPFGISGDQFPNICYWILPIASSAISGIAMTARQTRSAVLETIRADFVTTARAKGLPERKVIYKHMLPNALIPVVSDIGTHLGMVISGSVIIESVFAFPGVGSYMLSGISSRDYPVVRGCILILATFSAIMMLLTDLAYGFLDPRIKAQYINYGAKGGRRK